ncbi:hypothetical protein ACQWTT_001332 [Acinetobacter baumannii]
MNTNFHQFDSEVKETAKRLHKVLKLVIPHTDSLNQLEPCFKSPSLKQCYEIIANAYGAKTYNGLCSLPKQEKDEIKYSNYDSAKMELALKKYLIRENIDESSGIVEIIDLVQNQDKLNKIIGDVSNVFPSIASYPTLFKLNVPKRFYSKEFVFDWTNSNSSYFQIKLQDITFNVILTTIIENISDLSFITYDDSDSIMFGLPISTFYPHKINDFYNVRDIVIDLEDLLNSSGILKASNGHLELMDLRESHVNITMSKSLAARLRMISNFIKNQNLAIEALDTLLDVYLNQFNKAFQTIFNDVCITTSTTKRLIGSNALKYQIVKRMYYKILMNINGLNDRSIFACDTSSSSICKIEDIDRLIKENSSSITAAITELDNQYAKVILPFIDEYMHLHKELLQLVKPKINPLISEEKIISNDLSDALNTIYLKNEVQVNGISNKLFSAAVNLHEKI